MAHLVDRYGKHYPIEAPRWKASDCTPLAVSELPGIGSGDIAPVRSQWRYAAALPLEFPHPVSLGEGVTPLVPLREGVLAKLEWFNPTGSFKDRGASVMMSLLKQQGITAVLEDSSGNGGAAVAAYAAAAGIHATIMAPESTSSGKLLAARAYGAEIELIPGSRQDTADAALERCTQEIFYASHNWHPFFLQGTKLLAYEIWEDLGFAAPDVVITPCGAGSIVLGMSLGFGELVRAGQIERIPRIVGVQPTHVSPLVAAFDAGVDHISPGIWQPTLAEGTAIARPVRAPEVLRAVRESGGAMLAVGEEEIAAAARALADQGLYAEATSATALAALPQARAAGYVSDDDVVVTILTGTALKSPETMARIFTS